MWDIDEKSIAGDHKSIRATISGDRHAISCHNKELSCGGLYYFNARWYDATTGQFTSEDPARDGGNWYAYVGHSPLGYVDPTGLTRNPGDGIAGGINIGTGGGSSTEEPDPPRGGGDDGDDDDDTDRDRGQDFNNAIDDLRQGLEDLARVEDEERWLDRVRGKYQARLDINDAIERLQGALEDMSYEEISGLGIEGFGDHAPRTEDFTGVVATSFYVDVYAGLGLGVGSVIATEFVDGVAVNMDAFVEVSLIIETDLGMESGTRTQIYDGATLSDMEGVSVSGSATYGLPYGVSPQLTLSSSRTLSGIVSDLTTNYSLGATALPVSASAAVSFTTSDPGFSAAGEAASRRQYGSGEYTRDPRRMYGWQ